MLAHLGTLVIAGLMLVVWLTWLLLLAGIGTLQRFTRPPHGARCVCERCVREMERLAGCPTPPPLARHWFKTGAAWYRYESHRRALIARKTHYGFAPHRIDPYPPLTHDPDPAWPLPKARSWRWLYHWD